MPISKMQQKSAHNEPDSFIVYLLARTLCDALPVQLATLSITTAGLKIQRDLKTFLISLQQEGEKKTGRITKGTHKATFLSARWRMARS